MRSRAPLQRVPTRAALRTALWSVAWSSSSVAQGNAEVEAARRRIRRDVQVVTDGLRAEVRHLGIEPGVIRAHCQVAADDAERERAGAELQRPEHARVHIEH